jgi:hypothetical protein
VTIPPPRDTDEIPPTDPAPPTPTERVPSMTEEDFKRFEAPTAVGCPHPPGAPERSPKPAEGGRAFNPQRGC